MRFLIKFSRNGVQWGKEQRSPGPTSGFKNFTDAFASIWGSFTSAGVSVNHHSAMTLAAVYRAVSNIADDIAKLPVHLYREVDGRREKVSNHRSVYLLNQARCEWLSKL